MSHTPLILSKRQASSDSQQPPSSTSVKPSHMEMPPAATIPQTASSSLLSPHFLQPFAKTSIAVGTWGMGQLASREIKGNIHSAEIHSIHQLLLFVPFSQVLLLARMSPILPPAPIYQTKCVSPRERCPV